jgi:3D (Asp-Asp-Asp) domain-containing protein
MPFSINNILILNKRLWKKIIIGFIFLLIFEYSFFSLPALAAEDAAELKSNSSADIISLPVGFLPVSADLKVEYSDVFELTAYSSDASQCDGNPCRTASGFNLCEYGIEDSVAVNFLPFGTKIRIPDLFGDRIFVVRDRMNSRYDNRIDIWFKDQKNALKFGFKLAKVEILEAP